MKLKYNAPTSLTFALIAALILLLSKTIMPGLIRDWFSTPLPFRSNVMGDYFRLLLYPLGHNDINHYLSNFSFILLLGPLLEINYKSIGLFFMMFITALITGVLQVLFFPNIKLLGASGIVFMMILVASFSNFNRGEVPLTFILILLMYLGREIYTALAGVATGVNDNVSQFAHIIGGLIGAVISFLRPRGGSKKPTEQMVGSL